ncbi:hypothetical protein GJ629_02900 [Halapricum sp. CBA1109]|uniref:DUF5805 domain-containing protein n=1 Tax=Halapricum sp. CBA1109 TaxID=2668068 RepID=UPI0012F9A3FE|nr:DUF5805 domain-containing protein [Halapricum sp. CBA1109]MUV88969.1 hypothetical protein [Halapricum sp. CBA1109]
MSAETDRVAVKTYVPAYQKAEWTDHAERLEMSQSEFVRTMVQAGRRGFLSAEDGGTDGDDCESDADGTDAAELADRVQSVLSGSTHHSWEELLESLTDDIETRLDETLAELQEDNVVRYSGRHGGYTLVDR